MNGYSGFYEQPVSGGATAMIRFLCLNAFIASYSIMFCLWAILLSLFNCSARRVHFWVAVPWAKGILRVCGIKVDVSGKENVDPDVPRVYMVNHQSYFDVFVVLACLPLDFKFLLKEELMRIPLLGPAMRHAGYIGIERDDPRKAIKSMNLAAQRIKGGASVLIFPEGTRSLDGNLGSFKKGGFNLALKSGCDIVPVTISGTARIVPKGSLKIEKGNVGFFISRPIPLAGYSRRNVAQLMDEVRASMLASKEK